MSDNLEWMNRHYLLLEHRTVDETIEQELFPARTELLSLAATYKNSEDFLDQLLQRRSYKDVCSFLAYNLHKRSAVWWAYRCVLDLNDELKKKPAEKRSIDDIGKPKPLQVPEWARTPEEQPEDTEKALADFRSFMKQAFAEHEQRISCISQETRDEVSRALELVMGEVKKQHGQDIFEMFQSICEKTIMSKGQDFKIDLENSPIIRAEKELKEKIEDVRKSTIEKVKAALPEKDEVALRKNKEEALSCVYRYIISPDEDNAGACYEIGNKAPDTPEGLLALVAFWSFGDLMPKGETVVKTPSGLMANGINSLLLMLSLKEGGEKDFNARYEKYSSLGIEVADGSSNWGESIEKKPESRIAPPKFNETEERSESYGSEAKAEDLHSATQDRTTPDNPAKHISINRFRG